MSIENAVFCEAIYAFNGIIALIATIIILLSRFYGKKTRLRDYPMLVIALVVATVETRRFIHCNTVGFYNLMIIAKAMSVMLAYHFYTTSVSLKVKKKLSKAKRLLKKKRN